MTGAIPIWAQEKLTNDFVSAALADEGDRRTLVVWRKCLAKAIAGNWGDPKRRPKRDEETEDPSANAEIAEQIRRREAAIEARDRQERERLFAESAPTGSALGDLLEAVG